ncbi:hypothetical protein H4R24_002541 [Coemansia sp. RSA 988]|nr:hypothetical protein H4R24_002541 [Coemansia sp. RSA 988]
MTAFEKNNNGTDVVESSKSSEKTNVQSGAALEYHALQSDKDPEMLAGVRKKIFDEWTTIDKIIMSAGIFFIYFITALDMSATTTIQPRVLSDFNAMTRAGVTRDVSAHTAMLLQLGTVGYNIGLLFGGWAMQFSKRYRRWAWIGWALVLIAVSLMLLARSSGTSNATIAVVQAIYGIGGGIVVGCLGIGVQAAVTSADLSIAITLYSMVEFIGGVLGEGASTTIWVNVLPTKLQGRMNASVNIFSAINNITYYQGLPEDQRVIVQDGYIQTQRILTICGICSILLTGVAMLGLPPSDFSTDTTQAKIETETEEFTENAARTPKATFRHS